jgi:hypothetical protein
MKTDQPIVADALLAENKVSTIDKLKDLFKEEQFEFRIDRGFTTDNVSIITSEQLKINYIQDVVRANFKVMSMFVREFDREYVVSASLIK